MGRNAHNGRKGNIQNLSGNLCELKYEAQKDLK